MALDSDRISTTPQHTPKGLLRAARVALAALYLITALIGCARPTIRIHSTTPHSPHG